MTLDAILDWLPNDSGLFAVLGVMGGVGFVGGAWLLARLAWR